MRRVAHFSRIFEKRLTRTDFFGSLELVYFHLYNYKGEVSALSVPTTDHLQNAKNVLKPQKRITDFNSIGKNFVFMLGLC